MYAVSLSVSAREFVKTMKRSAVELDAVRYFEQLRGPAHSGNLALELLSNEDILTTMMRDRPRALLNLLASAKSLYGLLRAVPRFYQAMMDRLVVGETADETYAFYVCEFHTRPHFRDLLNYAVERAPVGHFYVAWMEKVLTDMMRYRINVKFVREGNFARVYLERKEVWLGDDWISTRAWMTWHDVEDSPPNPPFTGNGAGIVTSAARDVPLTSLCEIALYRFRDEWHASNYDQPESLASLPLDVRQQLCRIYTYLHPLALGPFHILDERRLYLHRLYMTFLYESVHNDSVNQVMAVHVKSIEAILDPAKYAPGDDAWQLRHEYIVELGKWVEWRREYGDDQLRIAMSNAESYDAHCTDPAPQQQIVDRLRETLAGETRYAFPETQALLAQPLPEAGLMLDLQLYRDQLLALYTDPAVARRTLIAEVRAIERRRGTKHTIKHYGACVQCRARTESVLAERSVFMCAQCVQ